MIWVLPFVVVEGGSCVFSYLDITLLSRDREATAGIMGKI